MRTRTVIVMAALVCGLLMVGGGVWAMSSGSYAMNYNQAKRSLSNEIKSKEVKRCSL